MKIFYAVQATGNGHISRAIQLLPYLEKYGQVDVFLSGANSSLHSELPVKYTSKGLSLFYTCNGDLSFSKTIMKLAPLRVKKEVRDLPVEKYDLVLNDFECITALACKAKKIPSVQFGHQASFQSDKTPRPQQKNRVGEWILKNYAKADNYYGLHFKQYDDFILTPVIKDQIWSANPTDQGYITVYLPSYCDHVLKKIFEPFKEHKFKIFSHQSKHDHQFDNLDFAPVSNKRFSESLINCHAIITGGGFETPAEALHMGKKILSIPIKGQYEQQCNGAALEQMGVKVLQRIGDDFPAVFDDWINDKKQICTRDQNLPTAEIVERIMTKAIAA